MDKSRASRPNLSGLQEIYRKVYGIRIEWAECDKAGAAGRIRSSINHDLTLLLGEALSFE